MINYIKTIVGVAICLLIFSDAAAQSCGMLPNVYPTPQPANCSQAMSTGDMVPYFNVCQVICFDNTGVGNSGEVDSLQCVGGSSDNDLFLYAHNPYATLNNYDGSLVFKWVDWPNKSTGALPPYFAVHGEVQASLPVVGVVQSINCTDGFALENAICVAPAEAQAKGNQFYTGPGTIPTLAELDPIVDAIAGTNVNTDDVAFWIQIVTSDGGQGPICVEVSPYASGFICGDATDITLTGAGNTQTGSAPQACLCESALYGGLGNVNVGLTVPCGSETMASAWYKITAPYGCNSITASLGAWGGSGDYNIAILKNVNCPGTIGTNPITGAATNLPGSTPDPGAAIVASGCTQDASTGCSPVPAGEYYIVVSGVTERPTFQLNVTVENSSPSIGTASSPQNNSSVCSADSIDLLSSGANFPLNATCGQDIAWFYSTNLAFNPYNGQGTYLGSGANIRAAMPNNMGCQPVTYYIKGVISDNGTTAAANCRGTTSALTVTVFPAIGNITISNSQCLITVATRCGNFTVNGNPGVDNYIGSFADDGNVESFLVSNGLGACNVVVSDTVHCSGNCTQPTASGVSACDQNDPYNFYVDVTFAPGSAATYFIKGSDGSVVAVSSAGTYRVGPFSNGSNIFITVENNEDSNCDIPVGNFSDDCNNIVCPNLTNASATVTGDVCEGDQTILQATVDQGTINVDYSIQWYLNGTAIPGANGLAVIHTFGADQGCSAEAQQYSVKLTCLLAGGSPSTTDQLNAGTVVVYPQPKLGIDFVQNPNNCSNAPVDICGGLDITYTPVNNPSPGNAPLTVNYTIKVPGAPVGCETTGSYVVNCPACTQSAGSGVQPADDTYCAGESFDIATTGAVLDTGYSLYWAYSTTNPYSNLNAAVTAAQAANHVFGPDTSGGNATYNFVNGTNYGPGQYYFFPFVAMDAIDKTVAAYTVHDTISIGFLGNNTTTVTIPDILYCNGITVFDMNLKAHQITGIGNPIDEVTGFIIYNSGSTTNIDVDKNNYTGNPSDSSFTIKTSSTFGASVVYDFTVYYTQDVAAGTVCPSCNDVGTPISLNLLPTITLAAITPPTACAGEVIDLTDLNPAANVAGRYSWYDGNPATTGVLIAQADSFLPTSGNTYYVLFEAADDSTCTATASVTINTTPAPTLNPIPPQPAVCFGETVDLTTLEAGITSAAGTFVWYKGDPDNGGIRLPNTFAQNLAPIHGQPYYAEFTSLATGCSNKTSITFTVNPIPVLGSVQRKRLCNGGTYDLTTLDTSYTTAPGTLTWYDGDPDNGGTQLTTMQAQNVAPDSGDVYFVVFVDAGSGCSSKGNVAFDVFSDPVLNTPNPAPLCAGEVVDLTSYNQSINSDPGSFVWYDGNPAAGGTMLTFNQAAAQTPANGDTYYVVFTNAITSCSATTSFSYTVNPKPSLNTVTPADLCAGDTVDLASFESQFTTNAGTFTWYSGNPDTGAAVISGAALNAQIPNGNELYYVVFADATAGCTDTATLAFTVNPLPVLNPIPAQGFLCAGSVVDLTALEAGITSDAGTFAWYDADPDTATALATPNAVVPLNGATYTVVFTNGATGCQSSETVTYTVGGPIQGISVNYDCDNHELVVNLANANGGSGAGYAVAASSPNQNGDSLAHGDFWTVYIEDSLGCADTMTGQVYCLVCEAGGAVTGSNTMLCCSDTLMVQDTGFTLGVNRIIAWGLTDTATGPVTSEAEAFAALKNYKGDETDGSLMFINKCEVPPGMYYLTPYISIKPNDTGTPIVWDTTAGCRPRAELCPTISGTDWVLDPMIITFPDGSTYNVNQELALGLPIDQNLLDAVTGGTLPCINITDIYQGDPNGTWSITITNTGTGAISFSVPNFDVIVSADTCTLITSDQIFTVGATTGTVQPGTTSGIDIVLPPASVTAPPVTYDTLQGCRPSATICPTISGTGWVLDPMILTFPDGSTYNVNQQLALGLPIDQNLLDAVTGGSLPCINLTDLYQGDPNGTWTISITNTGTGAINFNVPPYIIGVESDTCSLLTQDEITQMPSVSGTVQPNSSGDIQIVIPPPAVTFPAIDPGCEDYGDPIQVAVLGPISYASATLTCTDTAAKTYNLAIEGLTGGAPEVVAGTNYVFSENFTYDSVNDVYNTQLSNISFPYTVTIENDVNSVGGGTCGINVVLSSDPCEPNAIEETDLLSGLVVYPNPTEGQFFIDMQLTKPADVNISILNVLGEEVMHHELQGKLGDNKALLDMSDLAQGVYMVVVKTGAQVSVNRIVRH